MNKFEDHYEKVLKVIKSTKNFNHLESCERYLNLFEKKYEDDSVIEEVIPFLRKEFDIIKSKFID